MGSKFKKGDRVRLVKAPFDSTTLKVGAVGTVAGGGSPSPWVDWDDFTDGHDHDANDGRKCRWAVPNDYMELLTPTFKPGDRVQYVGGHPRGGAYVTRERIGWKGTVRSEREDGEWVRIKWDEGIGTGGAYPQNLRLLTADDEPKPSRAEQLLRELGEAARAADAASEAYSAAHDATRDAGRRLSEARDRYDVALQAVQEAAKEGAR